MTPTESHRRLLLWLTLKNAPGVGNLLFKRLIDRFGEPERVLAAAPEELGTVEGIGVRVARSLSGRVPGREEHAELEALTRTPYRVIVLTDVAYPRLLREIVDPPPLLYVHGELGTLTRAVALVGSRTPTRYGVTTTRRLAGELVEHGITVVSGMARGIDTEAHAGALDAGGRTVAVLGSGLNRIYPHENRDLFHRIARSGAVVSEFPLDTPPEPHRFPARNRVISGLSLGTVVVEASRKSGSLITARLALEQGREVFAVPGNIQSFKSAGTHGLIRQGAALVESARDILEELAVALKTEAVREIVRHEDLSGRLPGLSAPEIQVLRAIGPYPVHIDELGARAGMASAELAALLMRLELKGLIIQSPGKIFAIDADAVGTLP